MDPETLSKLDRYARESNPPITALVIVRHGHVVFEQYYGGFDRTSYFNMYSITKSVVSALVGRAVQQRLIDSLDQTILEFFPDYSVPDDERKAAITLRHVLSMTSGFHPDATDIEVLWRSEDVVQSGLQRPLAHAPGESFFYDDVSLHLLSILLTRLTGMSTAAFAHTALFGPLGIWADERTRHLGQTEPNGRHILSQSGRWPEDGFLWTIDRHGHNTAGFGLHLSAGEMAKLGYLYLNGGWWDGVQLLPTKFVEDSITRQSAGGPPVGRAYGYCWWIPEPHPAFFATGLGAQTIHVVPKLDLVTAFTTRSSAQEGEHRGRIVEGFVLPAVRQQ